MPSPQWNCCVIAVASCQLAAYLMLTTAGAGEHLAATDDTGLPGPESSVTPSMTQGAFEAPLDFPPSNWKELMKPNFSLTAEVQGKANDIGLASYGAGVKLPTYPLFGPPPPLVNLGFGFTTIDGPIAAELPAELFETEVGLAWMRRFNERWMLRLMAGTSFATDGHNNSSDSWQFRGGVFGIYQRNPRWTWAFGAIALGRNDLPIVPAVGVIYQPHESLRLDLMMPRPRISCLLVDHGPRQQWGYIGAALNGTTWGVRRPDLTQDQLTYGDFRVVLGWESTPRPQAGMPFTRGRKVGVELGYVFSRDFEWESDGSTVSLDNALMLRGSVSF